MFARKKPAVKATATLTSPAGPPAAPIAARARSPRISRETFLGLLVAGTFLSLVGAVMVVKKFIVPPVTVVESQTIAQNPQEAWQPTLPPATPLAKPAPLPPAEMPSTIVLEMPPAPAPTIQQVRSESPMIPEVPMPAPIAPPVEPSIAIEPLTVPMTPSKKEAPAVAIEPVFIAPEPAKKEPTPVAIDPIVVAEPSGKSDPFLAPPPPDAPKPLPQPAKDDFSSNKKIEAKTDPLDLPPLIDPVKPEVKNPVIVAGGQEKKSNPPPLEAPPLIAPPIEPEVKPEMKKDPPLIAPPIEPEVKKEVRTPVIETPMVEAPPKIETPVEAPVKKSPATIEFVPLKKVESTIPDAPATLKKDGDFDEDLHSLKQNESYRSLSKQYYNSEAYSIALQRYNKDHPGQADYVRIPPIWVLEKKYAGDITGSQARAVNFTAPPAGDAAPRTEPVYSVSDNGEMLADVARKQLGSEDAWKRIWDLNPQLNPAKAIPGGTRLRMPTP